MVVVAAAALVYWLLGVSGLNFWRAKQFIQAEAASRHG
jgi:hypothetical protein